MTAGDESAHRASPSIESDMVHNFVWFLDLERPPLSGTEFSSAAVAYFRASAFSASAFSMIRAAAGNSFFEFAIKIPLVIIRGVQP